MRWNSKLYSRIYYEQPTSTSDFKTDGVYLSDQTDSDEGYFFYQNGMVKALSIDKNQYLNNFDRYIESISNEADGFTKEYWGHYYIQGDSLIIQRFNRLFSNIYRRKLIENKALIIDSKNIKILSAYSVDEKKQFLDQPIILNFHQTKIKPDSSKAWFLKKEWYKNKIHPSRKIN